MAIFHRLIGVILDANCNLPQTNSLELSAATLACLNLLAA